MSSGSDKLKNQSPIRIAFVGHTNVGKTTTIRTLMKEPIGKVGDQANVTQRATEENYDYEGLQAVFIDTPGFQKAGTYLFMKEDGIAIRGKRAEELRYDIAAFTAIGKSDVVFYLASLENVPDSSHEDEVKLVVSSGKRVVALLNKGVGKVHSDGSDKIAKRVEQWRKVFTKYGIYNVFEFDAHWYISSKVSIIYESVESLLPYDRREVFKKGLNDFENFHRKIAYSACCLIAECVFECRKPVSDNCGPDDNSEEIKKKLIARLEKNIGDSFSDFVKKTSKLYYELRVNASNPDFEDAADSQVSMERTLNPREILLSTGALAGGTAVYAGAIGSVVGAIASATLTAGLGTVGGAWLGTQVGSAIGSFVGGAIALVDTVRTKEVSIHLPNSELVKIENLCTAIVLALSQHGYGLGPEVSQETLERRQELVKEHTIVIDWKIVEKDVAVQHCQQTLQKLADISPHSSQYD